jgi:hypothetical protein
MKLIGILIMIAGLGMTIFTAFSYFTREKVFEIGTVDVYRNQPHSLTWTPFIGLAIMVVGAFIVLQVRKR